MIIAIVGHETTANLLGAEVIRLMTPGPDGIRPVDSINAVDDRLITELLRLDGPVQAVARIATHSHVINDITIHAGELALVVLAAANPIRRSSPSTAWTSAASFQGHGPDLAACDKPPVTVNG